jgi:ubiquinone/menaquinone biosynthesis C-methylase UbiE
VTRTREVAAEFDQISGVYDATRDPLDPPTVNGLADALRTRGVRQVLEVGVGTGRVAEPLAQRGFAITGVEPSLGMLSKARAKGISRVVRGSGYHLPFSDRAFDATLFVHVLHVLDDPAAAIREGTRVARSGAFALVHPRSHDPSRERDEFPRHMLRDLLAEQGYPLPPRSTPWEKERDLLARLPPDHVEVVSEADVTESLRRHLDRLAIRGQRYLRSVPPEVVQRAIATAKERVGDRTVTYHRVEALATWGGPPGPAETAAA